MIFLDEISPRTGGRAGKPAKPLPPLPGWLTERTGPPRHIREPIEAVAAFAGEHLPRLGTDWKQEARYR